MIIYLIFALTTIIATATVDIFRAHQKISELDLLLRKESDLRREVKLSAIRYQRLLSLAEAEIADLKPRLAESRTASDRILAILSKAIEDVE